MSANDSRLLLWLPARDHAALKHHARRLTEELGIQVSVSYLIRSAIVAQLAQLTDEEQRGRRAA